MRPTEEESFSLVDKKLIRYARNALLRVTQMENAQKLGVLGKDAENLANNLVLVLQGKKII